MKPTPQEHDLDYIYAPDELDEVVMCCVCGALGSELLTWCPGEDLSEEARRECQEGGNVIDLERFRTEVLKQPHTPIYGDEDDDVEVNW